MQLESPGVRTCFFGHIHRVCCYQHDGLMTHPTHVTDELKLDLAAHRAAIDPSLPVSRVNSFEALVQSSVATRETSGPLSSRSTTSGGRPSTRSRMS